MGRHLAESLLFLVVLLAGAAIAVRLLDDVLHLPL